MTCAESHTTPTTLPLPCFTETAGILSKGNTTGYTWYNWPTKETRTDRASVRDEPPLPACGSVRKMNASLVALHRASLTGIVAVLRTRIRLARKCLALPCSLVK